ncbi:hypothetical protein [Sphingomonas phage Carli]|nr:hypothetical protein [Sphingomonas phage Carli]
MISQKAGDGKMSDKNLVPLKSIMVVREGKRVSPPIGKAFPFNPAEVKVLKEGVDFRAAVNEDEEADLASIMPERNSVHIGKAKTNAAGAGKTTAMVNGADGAPATGEQSGDANVDARLGGNVNEIKALVAEITDKADLAALRAGEDAGQKRAGVFTAIDARVAALTTDDDL